MWYKLLLLLITPLLLIGIGCASSNTSHIKKKPPSSDKLAWCNSHIEETSDGTTYYMDTAEMANCKALFAQEKEAKLATQKVVQHATLNTGRKQWNAILSVINDNALTDYQYDEEAIKSGRVKAKQKYDHWNYASYYEIQALKKQILEGIPNSGNVKVDCDDTMIHLYIALIKKGYPADQLIWNYYLVPPSDMTGVKGADLGGHAVLLALVEGREVYSLEDISAPRPASYIEDTKGYYNVMHKPMDEDIRSPWHYTDKLGYDRLYNKRISVNTAKATPAYRKWTTFLKTRFHRR